MLTLEELLKHNAEVKAAREKNKKKEVQPKVVKPIEEPKPEEEKLVVEEKEEPKKGKKPTNRTYMVVENIETEENK